MSPRGLLHCLAVLLLFTGFLRAQALPVVDAGPDRTVSAVEPFTLIGAVEGAYTGAGWEMQSPRFETYSSSGLSLQLALQQAGTYVFRLKVYQAFSVAASDTVTVTVTPPNAAGTSLRLKPQFEAEALYTPVTGNFSSSMLHGSQVEIHYGEPNGVSHSLLFQAPANGPLTVGVYESALGHTEGGRRSPAFVYSGNGQLPSQQRTRFEVKKITYGPDNSIVSFWATFDMVSGETLAHWQGEVRYNAESSYPSVNRLPGVFAGESLRAFAGTPVTIDGVVVDDGLPTPASLVTTWTKDYGDGAAVFADASAPQTTVTFSQPGPYALKLKANDGEKETSSILSVIVFDPNDETSLRITSEPGDPIGGGQDRFFDRRDGEFRVTKGPSGQVTPALLSLDTYVATWFATLTAPAGAPLLPGLYIPKPFVERTPYDAGLGLGNHFNLPGPQASVEVHRIVYGPTDNVQSFWATITLRATPDGPAYQAEFRYRANADVSPVNQAPGVYAGPDQRPTLPAPVVLSGLAGDDNGFAVAWSKVSGPGEVTFADSAEAQTTATFTAAGEYTLRLSASDGEYTRTDDVQIVVVDPLDDTVIRIASEPGEYVGQGENHELRLTDGDIELTERSDGLISIVYTAAEPTQEPRSRWYFEFRPPVTGFVRGIYTAPYSNLSFPHLSQPGLLVRNSLRHPSSVDGSFAIRELERDAVTGEITSLWITFTQRNWMLPEALTGEIRLHAHADTAPDFVPVVVAGEDQTIERHDLAYLHGLGADDAILGAALRLEWTKVSGPGPVAFADATAAVTTATMPVTGTYVLRLTASTETQTAFDDVTIITTPLDTSLRLTRLVGGQPVETLITSAHGTFTAIGRPDLGINLELRGPGQSWDGLFIPAPGQLLEPGLYQDIVPPGIPIEFKPSARLLGQGLTFVPDWPGGSFAVHRIRFGAGSRVEECWITFTFPSSQHGVVQGELRVHTLPNAAPLVTLPDDAIAIFGPSVQLAGTVIDDGEPAGPGLTVAWSCINRPDDVVFTPADQAETEARFAGPGTYQLRLEATDGVASTAREMIVHVTATSGRWAGILVGPDHEGNGFVQLTLTPLGTLTGSLRFNGKVVSFHGAFDAQGQLVVPLTVAGQSATLVFAPGQAGRLGATLTLGAVTYLAELAPLDGSKVPTEVIGEYVLVFPNAAPQSAEVIGTSWGRAQVRRNGSVALVLALADGTRCSGASRVNSDGTFATVLPLPGGSGWFSAQAGFNAAAATLSGFAQWSRRAGPGRSRFDAELSLHGTRPAPLEATREPLTNGAQPLPINLLLAFPTHAPLTLPATLGLGGRVSGFAFGDDNAQFTIRAGGIFSGRFTDPFTGRTAKFSGVIFPPTGAGFGYVLLPGQPGIAELVPQ